MIEIESLCPIALAGRNTKLVLAGDLCQLGPEAFSLEISSNMKYLSFVDRLNDLYPSNNPSRIKLQETYKNHKEIIQVGLRLLKCSLESLLERVIAY